MMTPVTTRFGDCELSPERLELRRAGQLVPLEPQVMDVLVHLVRHRDRVVTKAELLDTVWGSRFVTESALSSRIKSVRRAVGDTGRDQRVIRTIHGRGYRFVAEVIDEMPDGVRPPGATTTSGEHERPSRTPAEALLVAVDALETGRGAALQLLGPPGAERSAVLDTTAEAARRQDVVVLAAPGGSAPDADPVLMAVRAFVQQGSAVLRGLTTNGRGELERAAGGARPSSPQHWFVAVRELLVAAAEGAGVVLLVDDVDLADPATADVVDEAARLSRRHRVSVIATTGPAATERPGFQVVRLGTDDQPVPAPRLPTDDAPQSLRRVALLGPRFGRLDFVAASGLDPDDADRQLAGEVASGTLRHDRSGYAFAHPGAVAALADGTAPAARRQALAEIADRLAQHGASPDHVADVLVAAGDPALAAPHVLAAAADAMAAGRYDRVAGWTDAIRPHVAGAARATALALRADALAAVGDPAAVPAYRQALAAATAEHAGGLRARMARVALLATRMARVALLAGDIGSAQDALAGVEPTGGSDDAAILLARGMLAYFADDLDAAEAAVEAARPLALAPGAPDRLLDVITLQGMIAHNRGQWFDRLRHELRAGSENPGLAGTIVDSHLCVAEYLLYGPTPYDEVVALAEQLREQSERTGARRGVAFAATVAGEAALLAGDLDTARTRLIEAVDLHVAMGADTGSAHALQRLAEVELAAGDRVTAERMLRRSLALARWSPLARHLLQRVYGTLIAAAPDSASALAVVDEATAALDEPSACILCQVMIAVPASVACIEGGRLDEARDWLAQAARSAAMWQGTAWDGAVTEARAYLARAEGDEATAAGLFRTAADLFSIAGQPIDAQRCVEALVD